MEHDHHLHRGAALVSAAESALVSAGEQWTPMRASVFEVLAGQSRAFSAYDIAEAISRREGRRVAANSVYRILDRFVTNNLALRIESANAYVANPHPGCVHDCIFLLCGGCEQIAHVDDDDLATPVRARAVKSGFAVERTVIEVRGLCARCQAKRLS